MIHPPMIRMQKKKHFKILDAPHRIKTHTAHCSLWQ
uniref:Uncharacterized protein n=1 Tax=Anguilla anguilla TaxID=7936 RepID=A0A0E9PEE9_ANGAN